jgi:hypothetical protein
MRHSEDLRDLVKSVRDRSFPYEKREEKERNWHNYDRAQLKTGKYLGRITPEGLVEPKSRRIMKLYDWISVKEYGASFLLNHVSTDIIGSLQKIFTQWKEIFAFAVMRLIHVSSLKNVEFHYSTSYISETMGMPMCLRNHFRIC